MVLSLGEAGLVLQLLQQSWLKTRHSASRTDPAAYLGQVHVGFFEELGVIVGHQANDIIKHPVLFVHGDGEVELLHHREESTCTNTEFSPFCLKVIVSII